MQHLGYVRAELVKKTFEASTQDYPGVRHERGVMPKKSYVVRFSSLTDPMHIICCSKKHFSVDLLEDTQCGKNIWSILFYGIKSKLLAYYRPG